VPDKPTQREYWSGKVGAEWAAHADRIDIMLAPIADATLRAGAFQPGERVLDIGCGSGATSLEIARQVGATGAVVGVDLSPPLLTLARSRARDAGVAIEFKEADAGAADIGNSYDAAFSRFGVMFFEEPASAFAHIRAAMRPNGRLAFACWRAMAENAWATVPISAVEPMLTAPLPPPDPDAPGPYAFADPDKIARVLGASGWRNIKLSRWDGDMSIAGGGPLPSLADFLMRIGPCARAIVDQGLDAAEAKSRLIETLAPMYHNNDVALSGACWIVTANA
jgi:SAM-dependent methyltransferase